MLFDFGDNVFESEKERNLYYKFFCGYFLNELVEGWEDRLHFLCKLLSEKIEKNSNFDKQSIQLNPSTTHVTFDFHSYLIRGDNDNGELADIFIVDTTSKYMIAIEAKFLSNWDFEKDVKKLSERINKTNIIVPDYKIIQCLLVTESKQANVEAMSNHAFSNFSKLKKSDIPVLTLTWEELINECSNSMVREYFTEQTRKSKADFRLKSTA